MYSMLCCVLCVASGYVYHKIAYPRLEFSRRESDCFSVQL